MVPPVVYAGATWDQQHCCNCCNDRRQCCCTGDVTSSYATLVVAYRGATLACLEGMRGVGRACGISDATMGSPVKPATAFFGEARGGVLRRGFSDDAMDEFSVDGLGSREEQRLHGVEERAVVWHQHVLGGADSFLLTFLRFPSFFGMKDTCRSVEAGSGDIIPGKLNTSVKKTFAHYSFWTFIEGKRFTSPEGSCAFHPPPRGNATRPRIYSRRGIVRGTHLRSYLFIAALLHSFSSSSRYLSRVPGQIIPPPLLPTAVPPAVSTSYPRRRRPESLSSHLSSLPPVVSTSYTPLIFPLSPQVLRRRVSVSGTGGDLPDHAPIHRSLGARSTSPAPALPISTPCAPHRRHDHRERAIDGHHLRP
jgi:hypothetical protein